MMVHLMFHVAHLTDSQLKAVKAGQGDRGAGRYSTKQLQQFV